MPVFLQVQRQSRLSVPKTEEIRAALERVPTFKNTINMELHNYQKRTANFIATHPNCIISVDMGLGKTASVLAWADWFCRRRGYNVSGIIIAPKRVAENNWLQEAEKWGMVELSKRMVIVAGTPKKRANLLADDTRPIKIIGRDNYTDYKDMHADFLVIDELTSFKSHTSVRSKSVCSISAPIKIGLTGTLLANGAIDIFGQAAAVGLGWNGLNFYAWRASYFRDLLAGAGLQFSKWRLQVPLETMLKPIESNIFTLTAEDYLTIPPVTHVTHKIDVGAKIRSAILDLDSFLGFDFGGETLTFDEKQKFAKLQTLCDGFVYVQESEEEVRVVRGEESVKLEAVADFVADCKDAGEPVLLFYAFREEEKWLREMMEKRGVKCMSVKDSGFMAAWNDGGVDCLMAHPASAGHGLNLQHGGRTIVWSTLTYNYEFFAQGNARLARQGQAHNVQIHYFVADKTCEERVVVDLQRKQDEQGEFLRLTKQ